MPSAHESVSLQVDDELIAFVGAYPD
jgi:hypothetical protein